MDLELELFGDLKEKSSSLGKLYMLSLSSQPVDHEDPAGREKVKRERSPRDRKVFFRETFFFSERKFSPLSFACLFMHREEMRCTTPSF